ncbi:MAG TPA: transposase [Pseudonocardiaceae bacterium]|nr:transposase [Pseudonocardiaceae bacterium]
MGDQPCRQPAGLARQPAYIDDAHRVHAQVEDGIRTGKDCGIGHFPSHDFAINSAWLAAALIAAMLLAWLRLLALDADLARAEPKTLRYKIRHAAARLVLGGRGRRAEHLQNLAVGHRDNPTAWTRLSALPQAA